MDEVVPLGEMSEGGGLVWYMLYRLRSREIRLGSYCKSVYKGFE